MYASKRTIGKQGLFDKFQHKDKPEIKHGNRANRDGRKVCAQAVVNKEGKVVNTVYHFMSGEMKLSRVKKRLPKCIKKSA